MRLSVPAYDRPVTDSGRGAPLTDAVDGPPDKSSVGPSAPSTTTRTGRRRRWLLAGVVAVVVAPVVWLVADVLLLRSALTGSAATLTQVRQAADDGDVPAARELLAQAQQQVARAESHAGSWTVGVLGAVPALAADVSAVREVTSGAARLANDAMPGLLDALDVVDPSRLLLEDGRVDVDALRSVEGSVLGAAAVIAEVRGSLDAIDLAALRPEISGPVDSLRGQLASVAKQTATAARAVAVLPTMLGADGPRHYLVLVQNNAEFRALGGIPGAVMMLRAEQGKLTIVDHATAGDLEHLDSPVLPLTPDEDAIFGAPLGSYIQDVTFTPDFPRAAQLAAALWESARGGTIDGVLAADPVVLAGLLQATGPVTLDSGATLAGEDAVATLLNRVYFDIPDPAEQDAFFAEVATRVFGALTAGDVDGGRALDALAASAREGRVLLWSAHEEEQERLAGTVLSGELRGSVGDRPVVGVFLNDGSAAKMSYYLDTEVRLTTEECRPDGTRAVRASLRMTNTSPDPATLPAYLRGSVLEPGQVRTNYLFYAPTGGAIEQVWIDGAKEGVGAFEHHGLAVAGWTARLSPGESVLVEARMAVPAELSGDAVLRTTPAARGQVVEVTGGSCEKTAIDDTAGS